MGKMRKEWGIGRILISCTFAGNILTVRKFKVEMTYFRFWGDGGFGDGRWEMGKRGD
jgi:hypothetical protein